MSERPHPFLLVFGGLAEERFPPIRHALGDAPSLEAFLLSAPAIELLQALRPEEGLGETADDFVALGYAAYRFWSAGTVTVTPTEEETRLLCRSGKQESGRSSSIASLSCRYIQVAPRLVWASLDGGVQYEPLDGWFIVPLAAGLLVVALFGVHPERPGLSVIAVEGECPLHREIRADGTPPFAPVMAGGDAAGLHAIVTPDELLTLAWRETDLREEMT